MRLRPSNYTCAAQAPIQLSTTRSLLACTIKHSRQAGVVRHAAPAALPPTLLDCMAPMEHISTVQVSVQQQHHHQLKQQIHHHQQQQLQQAVVARPLLELAANETDRIITDPEGQTRRQQSVRDIVKELMDRVKSRFDSRDSSSSGGGGGDGGRGSGSSGNTDGGSR